MSMQVNSGVNEVPSCPSGTCVMVVVATLKVKEGSVLVVMVLLAGTEVVPAEERVLEPSLHSVPSPSVSVSPARDT